MSGKCTLDFSRFPVRRHANLKLTLIRPRPDATSTQNFSPTPESIRMCRCALTWSDTMGRVRLYWKLRREQIGPIHLYWKLWNPKMSDRHFEDIFKKPTPNADKTFLRHFQDICKLVCRKCRKDIFGTFKALENVQKMSQKCPEDIFKTFLVTCTKMSKKCLENVFRLLWGTENSGVPKCLENVQKMSHGKWYRSYWTRAS